MPEARPVDWLIAAACLAGLLLDGAHGRYGNGIDALGLVAAAATSAALLWRRRAPLATLTVVVVGVTACLATLKGGDAVVAPVLVALYTVADLGGRRRSLMVAAVSAVIVVILIVVFSPHGPFSAETASNLALTFLALVVGDAVRSRRAIIAATAERAQRGERLRIANDVHDVVAHAIVAINVQAGVAAHLLDRDPAQAKRALTEIKRVSGEALQDLRQTLEVLRDADAPVAPVAGLRDLDELIERVRAAGLRVRVDQALGAIELPPPVDRAGYRIVQEALTNVLRHAGPAHAEVSIRTTADVLEVEVTDDGGDNGYVGTGPGTGNGLIGIRERAASVGGTAHAGAREDGLGWRVRASLPLAR